MVRVISHMKEHNERFDKAVLMALRLVGGQAERVAKETISDMGAVDTGFLRNSITYAIAGEGVNSKIYYDNSMAKVGMYEGDAPKDDSDGEHTVYVGTNVYYAPYVEYGTRKMVARPFLSQSIQANAKSFNELFKEAFDAFL